MVAIPSNQITVLDIPEISGISAEFVYIRYEVSESVQEWSNPKNPPRYIKIKWNKPRGVRVSFAPNINNGYIDEQSIKNNQYSVFVQQDDRTDNKITKALDLFKQTTQDRQQENIKSQLDEAKMLNDISEYDISTEIISNFSIDQSKRGHRFYDKRGREINSSTPIPTSGTKVSLNNKFVGMLMGKLSKTTNSSFSDEARKNIGKTESTQTIAREVLNANMVTYGEFQTYVSKGTYANKNNLPDGIIGYVLTRNDGKEWILLNGNQNEFVDHEIKYGTTYDYSIKTLVRLTINSVSKQQMVVASKPSSKVKIECSETSPPPCPSDFNVFWNHAKRSYVLRWSFPVNTQQDIVKFQIFKRRNIKDSFMLVKEYDFYKGLNQWVGNENPNSSIVEKQTKTTWEDNQPGPWIYAVASVDAHGFSSNYSMQYKVFFNEITNKLEKQIISTAGAPRAYPNFWLNEDAFVDSIKTSGKIKKLSIAFMPEYLKVKDKNGNDLRLIKTNISDSTTNNTYILQMVDLDKQTTNAIEVKLNDLTTDRITK